jgi:tetratricopeptide (TPR) repeat protein
LKRVLHGQIGEFVEITFADSLSERIDLLAYHFYQGHAWSKALPYNLQAGERAKTEFANDIAITSFEHALEATEALWDEHDVSEEKGNAHEALGEVLTLVARYDDALGHYDTVRELVEASPASMEQTRRVAEIYRKTAEVYERQSEFETAFEWLNKGLDILDSKEPSIELVDIYLLGTGLYRRLGNNDDAITWCENSLELASKIPTLEGRQAEAQAYYNLGGIHYRRGDLLSSAESCQASLQVYEEIENIVGQAKALNNLGSAFKEQGRWKEASDVYHRSLVINRRIGAIQEIGFVTNNLGNLSLNRGDWDPAAELIMESNAIWKKIGAILPEAVTLSNLAQVFIYQEKLPDARDALSQSQVLFEKVGSDDFLAETERRWAEYHFKSGDLEEALQHVNRSITRASEHEEKLELGLSFRVLGEIQIIQKDFEEGELVLLRSLRILKDLKSEYESSKTELSLAKLRIESGAKVDREALFSARDKLKRLDAQADLAVAERLIQKIAEDRT